MNRNSLLLPLIELPPTKPAAVPLTFWRTLHLFNQLLHQPLSLKEAAAHLATLAPDEPPLSEDTLQVYFNTLRAVGCEIGRPGAASDFRYQMADHPFRAQVSLQQVQGLASLRRWVERHQDFETTLIWDDLVARLLDGCQLTERVPAVELFLTYLAQARSVDYRPWKLWIDQLRSACMDERLMRVTYRSARGEPHVYPYLPVDLRFENGAPFIFGLTANYPDMVSLRLDRITALSDWPDSAEARQLNPALVARKYDPPRFQLRVHGLSAALWQPLGLNETVTPAPTEGNLDLTVATHETFTLRQKLMALGRPVSVYSPDWFRDSLREQFQAMATLYRDVEATTGEPDTDG